MNSSVPQQALTERDELLFRQVHPQHVQNERVTGIAFDPSNTREPDRLSVARSSLTTPEAAFQTHVAQGRLSAGTYGVTVGECEDLKLQSFPDPTEGDPAHAFVSFSGLSKNQVRRKASQLAARATQRGRLYDPGSGSSDNLRAT